MKDASLGIFCYNKQKFKKASTSIMYHIDSHLKLMQENKKEKDQVSPKYIVSPFPSLQNTDLRWLQSSTHTHGSVAQW